MQKGHKITLFSLLLALTYHSVFHLITLHLETLPHPSFTRASSVFPLGCLELTNGHAVRHSRRGKKIHLLGKQKNIFSD